MKSSSLMTFLQETVVDKNFSVKIISWNIETIVNLPQENFNVENFGIRKSFIEEKFIVDALSIKKKFTVHDISFQ